MAGLIKVVLAMHRRVIPRHLELATPAGEPLLADLAGLTISFAGLFAGETGRRISLPSYPFQHLRHWVKTR